MALLPQARTGVLRLTRFLRRTGIHFAGKRCGVRLLLGQFMDRRTASTPVLALKSKISPPPDFCDRRSGTGITNSRASVGVRRARSSSMSKACNSQIIEVSHDVLF